MIRKMIVLAAVLAMTPALAQTTADQLAKPPADAKVWTITSSGGDARHGQVSLWTDASGTHWSRFSMNLRGFVSEVDEQNHFAPDGSIDSLIVRGFTPSGDAGESYTVKNGTYTYTSPVDHGSGQSGGRSRLRHLRRHIRFLHFPDRRHAEIAVAFDCSAAVRRRKNRTLDDARGFERHGKEDHHGLCDHRFRPLAVPHLDGRQ